MNYKCLGCGAILQDNDQQNVGYTKNINGKYCERCFRIKNYNDYKIVEADIKEFYEIIDKIKLTNSLVLLVVDVMSSGSELKNLSSKLRSKPLIVVSKRDIFSYKVNDQKILDLIDIPCVDKIAVSSDKNYNMDLLMEKINTYKRGKKVYVVGLTNSGKSTLINKIIYNYTDLDMNITTSMLPSTTLNTIDIEINDTLTLVDTPGIIDKGNITNYLDSFYLKKLLIKKEIKPITYQIKCKQYILVDKILKIGFTENCNITMYFSNKLIISRVYKNTLDGLVKKEINVLDKSDIVINGLGFITVDRPAKIDIYTFENVEIYVRNK